MSFVIAAPEVIAAAATDLASLESSISAANAAAAANTTALLAAGADEVSTAVAALFGAHGQAYQALSAQAQAFHAQFVQALTSGGGAYAAAEAAAVSPLLDPINEFFLANTGRPLIGNGANGAPGTGANGAPGGWLLGNGGAGGTPTTPERTPAAHPQPKSQSIRLYRKSRTSPRFGRQRAFSSPPALQVTAHHGTQSTSRRCCGSSSSRSRRSRRPIGVGLSGEWLTLP